MKSRFLRVSVLLLLAVANSAFAQLGPLWLGTWKSQDGDTTLTITESKIDYVEVRPDEKGKPETFNSTRHWTNRAEDAAGELEGVFGYAKKRVTPNGISKRYDESLQSYRRGAPDFTVSDPAMSRQAIGVMSPGVYKVMWSYSGGDCGYDEYIIDGDKILDVSECSYHFELRMFNRVR